MLTCSLSSCAFLRPAQKTTPFLFLKLFLSQDPPPLFPALVRDRQTDQDLDLSTICLYPNTEPGIRQPRSHPSVQTVPSVTPAWRTGPAGWWPAYLRSPPPPSVCRCGSWRPWGRVNPPLKEPSSFTFPPQKSRFFPPPPREEGGGIRLFSPPPPGGGGRLAEVVPLEGCIQRPPPHR